MLKILQVRLQQYMNRELPNVQAGPQRGRETRGQIASICWVMEKAREFQKDVYLCFMDYAKNFDHVNLNKLWKILRDGSTRSPNLCHEKLYVGQEATGHGTTDWFKIGKGIQGCILSPCLFNLHAGYAMQNAGLDKSQAGIMITGGNMNSLIFR